MPLYNIVFRILLLTFITFALAAPVLVQEKRQACVDEVRVPRDVMTMLGRRAVGDDLRMLLGVAEEHVPEEHAPEEHAAPPNPALVPAVHLPTYGLYDLWDVRLPAGHAPGMPAQQPNLAGAQVPEEEVPPHGQANSEAESMDVGDDGPRASSESGHSFSPPMSPASSKGPEGWHTAPSSLGSSMNSESDSGRWSTMSNAPSVESQSENLKAAESALIEAKGKSKASRQFSGTAGGVNMVNAAQIELQSAVGPEM